MSHSCLPGPGNIGFHQSENRGMIGDAMVLEIEAVASRQVEK